MDNKTRNILLTVALAVVIIFILPKFTTPKTEYSIVGNLRSCASDPITEFDMGPAVTNVQASTYCTSGYGLIDVFDTNYKFLREAKNSISSYDSGLDQYIVQVYCCPRDECSSNSDCPSGQTCTYKSMSSSDVPVADKNAYESTSFKYCKNPDMNTCWYKENGVCSSYDYDKTLVPDCTKQLYHSNYMFASQTACQSGGTCNSKGQSCDGPSNLQSGKPCCSGLTCANFQCVDTSEFVCGDGICQYTETKTSCPADCGTAPVCGDGKCDSGETLGATYYCPADCKLLKVGDKCSIDTECASNHCDRSHWYSLSSTCQAIPWDELVRVAATAEEIKTMTSQDRINIACISNKNCAAPDNLTSASCITISQLVKDGTISTTSETGLYNEGLSRIQSATLGGLAGGGIGAGLCVGAGAAVGLLFPPSEAVILTAGPVVCTAIFAGGTIIGAAEGAKTPVDTSDKNVIVQKLKAKDSNSVGLCVANDKGGGFCISQINDLLDPYTHMGCQTNTIIAIIVVLFGVILISRM